MGYRLVGDIKGFGTDKKSVLNRNNQNPIK
jgi:hypothetical protein